MGDKTLKCYGDAVVAWKREKKRAEKAERERDELRGVLRAIDIELRAHPSGAVAMTIHPALRDAIRVALGGESDGR